MKLVLFLSQMCGSTNYSSHFKNFVCYLSWKFWVLLGRFGGREGFQGIHGGRGCVLTKFGLKRTHHTPVHTIFHDFCAFSFCFSVFQLHISVPKRQKLSWKPINLVWRLIYLCNRDPGCAATLYICVMDTQAV